MSVTYQGHEVLLACAYHSEGQPPRATVITQEPVEGFTRMRRRGWYEGDVLLSEVITQ